MIKWSHMTYFMWIEYNYNRIKYIYICSHFCIRMQNSLLTSLHAVVIYVFQATYSWIEITIVIKEYHFQDYKILSLQNTREHIHIILLFLNSICDVFVQKKTRGSWINTRTKVYAIKVAVYTILSMYYKGRSNSHSIELDQNSRYLK